MVGSDNALMHQTIDPKALYIGTPVVLISTLNPDGSANLAPMSSVWWLGRTAMLGLGSVSHTVSNLRRTGECVINPVPAELVDAVDRIALLTGSVEVPPHKAARGYQYEPDKFGAAQLTEADSMIVAPPRVVECPLQFEARVTKIGDIGGDGSGLCSIEVETVLCHGERSVMVDNAERYIDPQLWDPLIMKFCEFYGGGSNLRSSSLAKGWKMPAIA